MRWHPLLSDAEIGDLLIRGKELVAWYKDLEEYATKALLDGKPIEGWKLVAGREHPHLYGPGCRHPSCHCCRI